MYVSEPQFKDARDIAFVFLCLASGLAIGTGHITIGIVGTILILIAVYILHQLDFGKLRKLDYILNFKIDSKTYNSDLFKPVFDEYLKDSKLLNVQAKKRGEILSATYNISLRDESQMSKFIENMNNIKSIENVNVVSSKNDLEF